MIEKIASFLSKCWKYLVGFVVFVLLLILPIFSAQDSSNRGAAILLTLAIFVVGVFVGFIFGIPRTQQHKNENDIDKDGNLTTKETKYVVNTNLEQISDWLTKILVGVGLTQLTEIKVNLRELSTYFSDVFKPSDISEQISSAVIIFYLLFGFLVGYLVTRLYLTRQFSNADLNEKMDSVKSLIKQKLNDDQAISHVNHFLDSNNSDGETTSADIKKITIQASSSAKKNIFYQAAKVRSSNWKDNKVLMAKTIPIFEALIESDTHEKCHRNFGQLGFALMEKKDPEWNRAEKNLTKAIEIRGPVKVQHFSIYELCRAICKIAQDPDYQINNPSAKRAAQDIVIDLNSAVVDEHVKEIIATSAPVHLKQWLKINKPAILGGYGGYIDKYYAVNIDEIINV